MPRSLPGIALALAVSARVASASDYSDFRIPAHSWSRFQMGLFGSYTPAFASDANRQERRSDASGHFSGSWLLGHESERLTHLLEVSGMATGSGRTSEFEQTLPAPSTSRENRDTWTETVDELWRLFGEVDVYPRSISLGFMARLQVQGAYRQTWGSEDRRLKELFVDAEQIHESSEESWRYSHVVSADVGLPWGRVRDVTGVQRVQYVEDRLRRDRVIHGALEFGTRQKLAELFYTESKFSLVHDLPDRAFWAEFERILREDPGVRDERLDAYAIYHAADPLVVGLGFGRMAGISVTPVITFSHVNEAWQLESQLHDRTYVLGTLVDEYQASGSIEREYDDQAARAGGEIKIEQPLGLRWHLSAFGAATSDLRAFDRDVRVSSSLSLGFWQGERWYWTTYASHDRRYGSEVGYYGTSWQVRYGTGVFYFLEDHVSIDFGIGGQQAQYGYQSEEYSRVAQVVLGLSYRTGSLTAPGLFAPVRPIP